MHKSLLVQFDVKIDPYGSYKNIINNFGNLPPAMLAIPYSAFSSKYTM